MIKQILLIIILSVVAIFLKIELARVLDLLIYLHNELAKGLAVVFSNGWIGKLLQDVLALLVIPFIFGLVIALLFKLVKRGKSLSVMGFVWVVWLVLLVTMVAQNQSMHKTTHMSVKSDVTYLQ